MIERNSSASGAPSARERLAAFGFGEDVGIPTQPPAVAAGVAQAAARSAKQAAIAQDAWVSGQGYSSSLIPSDLIQLVKTEPLARAAKQTLPGMLGALGRSAGQAVAQGAVALGHASAQVARHTHARPTAQQPMHRAVMHSAHPVAHASPVSPQIVFGPPAPPSASRSNIAPPPAQSFHPLEISQEDLRIYSSPDPSVSCAPGYSADGTGAVCIRG